MQTRDDYAAKLTHLGIPANPEDVITSGFVLAHHLANTEPHLRLYVIGEENLRNELLSHGLTVVDDFIDQDQCQVISVTGVEAAVVAFDRTWITASLILHTRPSTKGRGFCDQRR